jgi:hypothetical protein
MERRRVDRCRRLAAALQQEEGGSATCRESGWRGAQAPPFIGSRVGRGGERKAVGVSSSGGRH